MVVYDDLNSNLVAAGLIDNTVPADQFCVVKYKNSLVLNFQSSTTCDSGL